ncbi:hypothetical protein R3P38DRAFT_3520614, partial [Favolaschia claudopus]
WTARQHVVSGLTARREREAFAYVWLPPSARRPASLPPSLLSHFCLQSLQRRSLNVGPTENTRCATTTLIPEYVLFLLSILLTTYSHQTRTDSHVKNRRRRRQLTHHHRLYNIEATPITSPPAMRCPSRLHQHHSPDRHPPVRLPPHYPHARGICFKALPSPESPTLASHTAVYRLSLGGAYTKPCPLVYLLSPSICFRSPIPSWTRDGSSCPSSARADSLDGTGVLVHQPYTGIASKAPHIRPSRRRGCCGHDRETARR